MKKCRWTWHQRSHLKSKDEIIEIGATNRNLEDETLVVPTVSSFNTCIWFTQKTNKWIIENGSALRWLQLQLLFQMCFFFEEKITSSYTWYVAIDRLNACFFFFFFPLDLGKDFAISWQNQQYNFVVQGQGSLNPSNWSTETAHLWILQDIMPAHYIMDMMSRVYSIYPDTLVLKTLAS